MNGHIDENIDPAWRIQKGPATMRIQFAAAVLLLALGACTSGTSPTTATGADATPVPPADAGLSGNLAGMPVTGTEDGPNVGSAGINLPATSYPPPTGSNATVTTGPAEHTRGTPGVPGIGTHEFLLYTTAKQWARQDAAADR
jgi:hypothetical protein